jgi:hypothetical protein
MVTGLAKGIGASVWRKFQGSGGDNPGTGGSDEDAEKIGSASDRSGTSEVFYDGLEVLEQWQHVNDDKKRFAQLEIGIVLNKDTRTGFLSRLNTSMSSIFSFLFRPSWHANLSDNHDPDEGVRVVREVLRTLTSTEASRDYSGTGVWSVNKTELACQPEHLLDIYQQSGAIRSFPLTLKSSDLFIGKPHADSTNVLYQCDALKDTLALLHHLQTAFNSTKRRSRWSNYSIATDSSCFVNIHIGNKTEPPSLKTVKNVTKFLLVNESVIDSSHAIHRVAHYNQANHLMQARNKSLSSLFSSSTPSLAIGGSPLDWLNFINRQNSITSLQHLYLSSEDPNQFYTLNLRNLYCRTDPETFDMAWSLHLKKGTFEFRQTAGTLDPTALHHRVTFYNAVVELAERLTSSEMGRLCKRQWQKSLDYRFQNLLEDISCPRDTIEYYKQVLNREFIAERSLIPRNVGLAIAWLFAGSHAFMRYFVEENEEERLAAMDPGVVLARVRDNGRKGFYGARPLLSGFPF